MNDYVHVWFLTTVHLFSDLVFSHESLISRMISFTRYTYFSMWFSNIIHLFSNEITYIIRVMCLLDLCLLYLWLYNTLECTQTTTCFFKYDYPLYNTRKHMCMWFFSKVNCTGKLVSLFMCIVNQDLNDLVYFFHCFFL